jgi:flagellar motility protein MotE (MotC chaperone)
MTQERKAPSSAADDLSWITPAQPAGSPGPASPPPRERELEAENAENAQLREELEAEQKERRRLEQRVAGLEQRVAELERWLEDARRPYRSPLPHGDMGP